MNKVLFSSNCDEWSTPTDLYCILNSIFNFTLDPCSTDLNHLCSKYYTIDQNGLNKSWRNEIVFCNPPYSEISLWCRKCFLEWLLNGTKIVLLIPSRTDTKYFHKYVYHKSNLLFLKGRLHFSNSKNSAPFPSLLAIYN